jgi:shikimate kinase
VTLHLYLVGYRGTGKTTVGRLVAAALGWPFVDLDERIEAVAGRSIADIFADEGEDGFRDRESAALREVALLPLSASERGPGGEVWSEERENKNQIVISTGGGIVLREENRKHIVNTGLVVWLQASAETIWARLQADATTAGRRPNLSGGGLAEIIELLALRERFYQDVSEAPLNTDDTSPEALAATILTMIDFSPSD